MLSASINGNRFEMELGPLRSEPLRVSPRRLCTHRGTTTFFVDLFNVLNISNVGSVNGFTL